MAALFESGMFVREPAWHGQGVVVQDAPDSKTAIEYAGINWLVINKPVFDGAGSVIPGYFANTRDSDGKVLGIVGSRYSIVQNSEAFEFTDSLVGSGDVVYETAGSLKGGKQIWLLARMPKTTILGDDVDPYLCFMNTHDGTGAVKVCMTPVRVVCNNTLNFALKTAKRTWSARHTGSISAKLAEAKETLGLANLYMSALVDEAERLVDQVISDNELEAMFDKIYMPNDNATQLQMNRFDDMKIDFFNRYNLPDVAPFKGTKYGALMAATDFVDHREPVRLTRNYQENHFKKVIEGHSEVDQFYSLLTA